MRCTFIYSQLINSTTIKKSDSKQHQENSTSALQAENNDLSLNKPTTDDQFEDIQSKLDYDPNEKFPCLAEVVNFRKNFIHERHLIATENISIGKVIIVEKNCPSELFDDEYMGCNNCCKENQNFIPCMCQYLFSCNWLQFWWIRNPFNSNDNTNVRRCQSIDDIR